MVIEAIIFDNDGVLTDSDIVYSQTLTEILQDYGINESVEKISEITSGKCLSHAFKAIEDTFSIKLKDDILQTWDLKANKIFEDSLQPCDGVVEMLLNLDIKKAVASGAAGWKTKLKHKSTGLDKFFTGNYIFSGPDLKNNKPAPDVYLHAAKGVNVNPKNCIAVEDSCSGIKSAKAANMIALGYIGASHIFNKEKHSAKLINAGADFVFENMSELPSLINEINKKG